MHFLFDSPFPQLFSRIDPRKTVFVLGVYASAVHARWVGPNGKNEITALAVASEPSIFWRGNDAESIVEKIDIPGKAGRLEAASETHNGPSGVALDELFLAPLGLKRDEAWLCDLVPYSCMNSSQAAAVERKYMPLVRSGIVPEPRWAEVPKQLTSSERIKEIEVELGESKAPVIITLGDKPLRWFTHSFGSKKCLSSYGKEDRLYGQLHPIKLQDRMMRLLPLVHPRQAAGLGLHSPEWKHLHKHWIKNIAPSLLDE